MAARFFVPASVIRSVPVEKSRAATPILPGTFAPLGFQCSRPAIIRWMTTKRSSSSAMTMRLPSRRTPVTARPTTSASDGSTERSTNGVVSRRRSSRAPVMRSRRASTYTVTSGSSGTAPASSHGYNGEPMTPLLEARHLVKSLGGRRVVDGVDLECHGGQILGLLGPNGAGKTTTLRMLYGFLKPDGGTIRFDGLDAGADLGHVKRYLGVCTQDDTFDADFSVEQNLTIAARYFRPGVPALRRRVDELLDRFGLRAYATMRPETLSGGFKRRLMIARALVHRPRLLFLDEPTTGLDPQARMGVWDLVDGLRAEGLGIILTTHYMDEAERLSDALTVLAQGKVVAHGTPKSVMGDMLGEHVVVLEADAVTTPAVAAWLA